MRRSRDSTKDLLAESYNGRTTRLFSFRVLGVIALAVALLPLLFFGGEYVQRYSAYSEARESTPWSVGFAEPLRDIVLNTLYEIPMPARNQRLLDTGLPVYDLQIRPKDLAELQRTAERVTARYESTGVEREYVPARFWMDAEWVPIQVKLRGLYHYHYLKNHPSLRLMPDFGKK